MVTPPPRPKPNLPQVQQTTSVVQSESKEISTDISAFYKAVVNGDISGLDKEQQAQYLVKLCESLNLNPMTRPFAFIKLDGKLTVYALKECSAQLARRDTISVSLGEYRIFPDQNFMEVTARAVTPDGRYTDEIGAVVFTAAMKGEAAANARMKLATKAKRRAILSHAGLGVLDESELETIAKKEYISDASSKKTPIDISERVSTIIPEKMEQRPTELSTDNSIITDCVSLFDNNIPVSNSSNLDADSFNYQNDNNGEWLIEQIRAAKPGIRRMDGLVLAKTFCNHTSKQQVLKDLNNG